MSSVRMGKRMGASAKHTPQLASYASSSAQVGKLRFSDETGLLALGGDGVLEIVQVQLGEESNIRLLYAVPLGARVTALDFTSNTRLSDDGRLAYVQLIVACSDVKVRAVSAEIPLDGSPPSNERVILCGSGGHRLGISALACCRAAGHHDVFVTVGEDARCFLWRFAGPEHDEVDADAMSPDDSFAGGRKPTITAIPHVRPLVDVAFHPRTFGLLATLDDRGRVQLLDWPSATASPRNVPPPRLTFVDPAGGAPGTCSGSLDWASTPPYLGVAIGSRFAIWNEASTAGGTPVSVPAFPDSSDVFRWSPTDPDLFAVASSAPPSPRGKPAIQICRLGTLNNPRQVDLALGTSATVNDLAWVPSAPVVCVALGHRVILFAVADA